jgi:hypothetical protein
VTCNAIYDSLLNLTLYFAQGTANDYHDLSVSCIPVLYRALNRAVVVFPAVLLLLIALLIHVLQLICSPYI